MQISGAWTDTSFVIVQADRAERHACTYFLHYRILPLYLAIKREQEAVCGCVEASLGTSGGESRRTN